MVPDSIGQLSHLYELDLSGNQLSRRIPKSIGQISSLDRLDLSMNWLSGRIPQSIGQLSSLSYMNLSVNHLEGEISEIHFSKLFNLGALNLSGNSLLKFNVTSGGNWWPKVSSGEEDADELITHGLGFVVGFWGVCGSLIFKRSWRYAYYNLLNNLNDWLYVKHQHLLLGQ
ncbi:hypothetical protein ACLB2K_069292 [Fragaria x ananassa]